MNRKPIRLTLSSLTEEKAICTSLLPYRSRSFFNLPCSTRIAGSLNTTSYRFMSASGQGGGNALPSYRQAGALLFL